MHPHVHPHVLQLTIALVLFLRKAAKSFQVLIVALGLGFVPPLGTHVVVVDSMHAVETSP